MRRTNDDRPYALMTYQGQSLEVHPEVFLLLNFMMTNSRMYGQIQINVNAGNFSNGCVTGLSAKSIEAMGQALDQVLCSSIR